MQMLNGEQMSFVPCENLLGLQVSQGDDLWGRLDRVLVIKADI